MKLLEKQVFKQIVIHISGWIFPYLAIVVTATHSPSRHVYGFISGWWCALYVGYLLKISLRTALAIFLLYLCYGVLAILFGWDWFYHDIPALADFDFSLTCFFLFIIVTGALFFVSPIIINHFVRHLLLRSKNRGQN